MVRNIILDMVQYTILECYICSTRSLIVYLVPLLLLLSHTVLLLISLSLAPWRGRPGCRAPSSTSGDLLLDAVWLYIYIYIYTYIYRERERDRERER